MRIQIYSKSKCPLCDDAKRVLMEVQQRFSFEWTEVNIESDPSLYERYRYDVPLVMIDGRPAFKHRVDAERLHERLSRNSA